MIAPAQAPTGPPATPIRAPAERAPAAPAPEASTEFQVQFDKESQMYLVRLVDPRTNEVVVQIPPQQVLNLVSQLLEQQRQKGNNA